MRSSYPNGIEMKIITPKIETIFTGVKAIYQNPYHYVYVIQKEDNFIYLYDEMTMEYIGKSKVPFNDTFRNFTFTDNFNIFCTYIEGKPTSPLHSQIIVFNLNPEGVISHQRHNFTRSRIS